MKMTNLRLVLAMTVLTGVVYPLIMTGIGQLAFHDEVNGSLLRDENGKVVGSSLVAQPFQSPKYFQSRPSAGDYATMPSGASNLSPVSRQLLEQVQERAGNFIRLNGMDAGTSVNELPSDVLFTSGSGLDPHISPAAAALQASRVAGERGIPVEKVKELVEEYTSSGGPFGSPIVRVVALNLALDQLK